MIAAMLAVGAVLLAQGRTQSAKPADALTGHWVGTMVRQGAALRVEFDFAGVAAKLVGRFSCETQRCLDYPLSEVSKTDDKVRFALGDDLSFDGKLSGDDLAGTFRDDGEAGAFSLRREPRTPLPYKAVEVRFKSGNVMLVGTLCVPRGRGRCPAIVFNHGSGPESRWGTNRFWADRFARSGIAALCYDKRGVGESTGDWRKAGFEELAEDALAAIRLLGERPDVDAERIGIYGHSQGGLLAPLVAAKSGHVAFVIAAAAFGDTVYKQDVYRVRNMFLSEGYSGEKLDRAMALYALFIETARNGGSHDRLNAAIPAAKKEPWFEDLGLPPDDHWIWSFYPHIGNYNPIPSWEKVKVPVFLIYGEKDSLVPPAESCRAIEAALDRAGNGRYTAVFLPDAAHNLTVRPEKGRPFFWWHVAPGLADLQIAWVRRQVSVTKQRW